MTVSGNELAKRTPSCPEARLDYATAYSFGDLGEHERQFFENHLLECDVCWADVRRLDGALDAMRARQVVDEPRRAYDMFLLLGISARLMLPFGGHFWHVLIAVTLYACLYAVALVLEVAYQFNNYPQVWWVSAGVFLWILGTSLAGLSVDWKLATKSQAPRIFFSIPIFAAAALLLYSALRLYLPDNSITEANFQTYPAHAAYLKDIIYFFPLGVVFLILPYHFILSMQRELQAGRYRLGLALLSGEKWGLAPKGSIYLRLWWLGPLLFGAFVVSLALTAHLSDSLTPSPFKGFFVQLVQWRMILYFGLGIECLLWYYRALNELKRECLGMTAASTLTNNQSR